MTEPIPPAEEKAEGRAPEGRRAPAAVERLSRRERQMLQGLLAGLSNKGIARRLGLSPRTVEMHRANMMAALGAASLSAALRLAIDAELPPLDEEGQVAPPPRDAPRPPEKAEAIRRLDEEKMRLVLEASGDGVWDWDVATGEIRMSQSLVERLGFEPAALPDRLQRFEPLLHPYDRGEWRRRLDDHLAGRSDHFACEYRVLAVGGGWRWSDVRGRIVERDPVTGEPLRMVGTTRDATARKAEEARAREAAALLDLARLGAGAALWNIDLDSATVHLCVRGRELHGLERPQDGELPLGDYTALLHPDDRDAVVAAIDQAVASGAPATAEFRVRRADGGWRRLLAIGKTVEKAEGGSRLVGLTQEMAGGEAAAFDLGRSSR